jgi:hypothetical protein
MIILAPIALPLLAAIAILILNRRQPKFGISWIVAAGTSLVNWMLILFLRLRLPTSIELLSWQGSSEFLFGKFSLLIDYDNWPYLLSLMTITLAVIFTDSARTRYDSTPQSWGGSLVITALSLLALQSGTCLTLIFTWVIVDAFELIYYLKNQESSSPTKPIIQSYAVRMASILMLLLGIIQGWKDTGCFELTQIPGNAALYLLLAAGLRLGVLPLNLPILEEPALRRGVGNILRLAPITGSLSLLARLPVDVLPISLVRWNPLVMVLLSIAAVYAAIRWFRSIDEIEGRPFWIIAWAALATASVFNGAPKASLAWGAALLLPGSLIFLYSPRVQRMNFLIYFGLLGLVGLPLTPIASGWAGLTADSVTVWTFVFIITHALMVVGYIKKIVQPGGEASVLESWARLAYPLGLIFIIQAIVILGLIGWPGSFTTGRWWLAALSLGFIALTLIFSKRTLPGGIKTGFNKLGIMMNKALPYAEKVFHLGWLYSVISYVYHLIGMLLRAFSSILESEGGLLWTILLLVLLVSVFLGIGTY